ncbi:PKD domain-containing protein, partial [bacterium]|nr:PKD domain-containing protein [bacterium]
MKHIKLLLLTMAMGLASQWARSQTCEAKFSPNSNYPNIQVTTRFLNQSSATSLTHVKYIWNFGDGNTSTYWNARDVSHHYTSVGTYNVCLQVIDSLANCSDTYCDSIYIAAKNDSTLNKCYTSISWSPSKVEEKTISFMDHSVNFNSDATYLWRFGDGDTSHTQYAEHTFATYGAKTITLIVSDSVCTDSTTQTVNVSGQNCYISLYPVIHDSCKVIYISKSVIYALESKIKWTMSDGATDYGRSITHHFTRDGTFIVHAEINDSASGCFTSYTDSIAITGCDTLGNDTCLTWIGGTISRDSLPTSNAVVYLIAKDSNYLSVIDSTYTDSSGYYLFQAPCDSYLVKCALLPSDSGYAYYLPTYYRSALQWSHAKFIRANNSVLHRDIEMTGGNNNGGPGFIGGDVTQGANKKDKPLPHIQITILDENMLAVSYTYSNNKGQFEIPNLALGKYLLFVDIPGLKSEGTWITLSKAQPRVEDVKVEINSNDVSTSIGGVYVAKLLDLQVFPNPANSTIKVMAPIESGTVQVTDLSGKTYINQRITQNAVLDISALANGAYIIKVWTKDADQPASGHYLFMK